MSVAEVQLPLTVDGKELVRAEPQSSTALMLSVIAEAARNPDVDAAKMRALWELKQSMDEQASKDAFHRAMQAVQEEIRPVVRNSQGQNSRYARLETIDRSIRPIYTAHGFSMTFGARTDAPGSLVITCDCLHREGYVKHYELPGALDSTNKAKSDIQALGSTVTYLRRYLTCLIFNIILVDEDDDGHGSAGSLSLDQLNKIRDLVIACNMDERSEQLFARFMGVAAIDNIPARDYAKALTALQAKLKKVQEGRS